MIRSLFGPTTVTSMLRGGLEETSATQRGIAARVAQASASSTQGDFASQLEGATRRQTPEVDLQQEMAALADTQIRYEASAKLLNGAYAKLRNAIRNNG